MHQAPIAPLRQHHKHKGRKAPVLVLSATLAACLLCVACSKPSRMQQVETAALENQNGLKEMEHRVAALENRVETLAVDVQEQGSRTFEVRNRAGRTTGMTIHPVAAAIPRPVSAQASTPQAPPVATSPTDAGAQASRTAPPRTMADVEKENGPKSRGNSSPALSLPPSTAVAQVPAEAAPGAAPASVLPPSKMAPATPKTADAKAASAPAMPPQGAAQSAPTLALPPEGASAPTAAVPVATLPAPGPAPKAAASGTLPSAAKGEEATYKAALQLVTSGRSEEGRAKFQAFLQSYPSGRYAANAHYWIGESYYSQRNYPDALMAFKQVSTQFPRHHKTADALLKAGMTYQKLGDKDNAQLQFKALQSDFPQSEAAQRMRGRAGR